jgi:hypothetical protein
LFFVDNSAEKNKRQPINQFHQEPTSSFRQGERHGLLVELDILQTPPTYDKDPNDEHNQKAEKRPIYSRPRHDIGKNPNKNRKNYESNQLEL